MRCFVSVTVLVLLSLIAAGAGRADDAADIKALIPAATAMSLDDLKKLATATEGFKPSDFAEQSLTLILLSVQRGRSEEAEKEFKWLSETADPRAVVDEMRRQGPILKKLGLHLEPFTCVRADRITGCTCTVKEDTATGTVSFQVPDLYAGKFDYVAKRNQGKWQIVELMMPARKIHIVRNEKGTWSPRKQPAGV